MQQVEFRHHRGLTDVKASFLFGDDGFTVAKKDFIEYAGVTKISRVYYERQTAFGVFQADPNKYRIDLRGGTSLEFCVAHKEEDAHHRSLQRLNRKIYGGNALGVGLASKAATADKSARDAKDRRFEEERPSPDFSLEKAILELLCRCGLALDDQTVLDSGDPADPRTSDPRAKRR